MICLALGGFAADKIDPVDQDDAAATYAKKIDKAEARIKWSAPAATVARQVNAFAPWPGAWSKLGEERVKILAARAETGDGTPGFALDENLLIACGDGALRLTRLQREGKRPADAVDFLRGRAVDKGTVFE